MDAETLQNTIANLAPPPLETNSSEADSLPSERRVKMRVDEHTFVAPQPPVSKKPAHSAQPAYPTHSPQPAPLAHFSYTCPGIHDAGSKMLVERWTFSRLLNPKSAMHVVIPLFQRAYCWNPTTTVPAWWRDTARGEAHSCGKLMFKQHDNDWWCLDGQQRVTTTMLLVAAARDALLRLKCSAPDLSVAKSIGILEQVLFVDVSAAHEFASSGSRIASGQRLLFSRLVPSYCDRQNFFELIVGGLAADGTDTWLSDTTRHSAQFDTKHYFDGQFQLMIDRAISKKDALATITARVDAALNMQLMMIEFQSSVNLAQVYQWLQEKSLISMGALLFNPTPGMKMHACDLTRNLFISPWAGESLGEQEQQHAVWWLAPIEIPCGGSPVVIDKVLQALVERDGKEVQSETENQLIVVSKSPGFANTDLSGLLLYGRVLTLWETLEESLKATITDSNQRQRHMGLDLMKRMAALVESVL